MRIIVVSVLAVLLGALGSSAEESTRQKIKVDDTLYPVYLLDKEVKPKRVVPPDLPPDAYSPGRGGTVTVGAVVDEKGWVASTFVSKSTADRDIQRAMRKAVEQWRFPKIKDGDVAIKYVVFVPLGLGSPQQD